MKQAKAQETLAHVKSTATVHGIEVETQIVKGEVSAEGIIKAAEDLKIDLIVMGSHGRKGVQKFFLGSFAQDVLGNTELPVLIVKIDYIWLCSSLMCQSRIFNSN